MKVKISSGARSGPRQISPRLLVDSRRVCVFGSSRGGISQHRRRHRYAYVCSLLLFSLSFFFHHRQSLGVERERDLHCWPVYVRQSPVWKEEKDFTTTDGRNEFSSLSLSLFTLLSERVGAKVTQFYGAFSMLWGELSKACSRERGILMDPREF